MPPDLSQRLILTSVLLLYLAHEKEKATNMNAILSKDGLLLILIGAYILHTTLFYLRISGSTIGHSQEKFHRPIGAENLSFGDQEGGPIDLPRN